MWNCCVEFVFSCNHPIWLLSHIQINIPKVSYQPSFDLPDQLGGTNTLIQCYVESHWILRQKKYTSVWCTLTQKCFYSLWKKSIQALQKKKKMTAYKVPHCPVCSRAIVNSHDTVWPGQPWADWNSCCTITQGHKTNNSSLSSPNFLISCLL